LSIKQLAGQTVWYGISSIAARFINYLLTPLLTYNLADKADYGKIGLIYSAIPILNIIFTYGFETAYFRFAGKDEYKKDIFSTSALSLLFSTILLSVLLWIFQGAFGAAIGLADFPSIIQISIFIVAFDALATIPFARLRQEQRPRKYAFIKIVGILFNIFVTWFYVAWCPKHLSANSNSIFNLIYSPHTNPVVYVLIANLIQNIFTLMLLGNEIKQIKFRFNTELWKQMMIYSMPLIIAGMGGMINETFDRLMLRWWLPGAAEQRETQVGIYNACYKLSLLITLFVQSFRLGAEPLQRIVGAIEPRQPVPAVRAELATGDAKGLVLARLIAEERHDMGRVEVRPNIAGLDPFRDLAVVGFGHLLASSFALSAMNLAKRLFRLHSAGQLCRCTASAFIDRKRLPQA